MPVRKFLVIVIISLFVAAGCDNSATNSTEKPDPPAAPKIDSITSGNGTIAVYWGTVKNAENYSVFYDSSSGITVNSDEIPNITSVKLEQSGLKNGKTYYFRVAAIDKDGLMSGLSNEVSATPATDNLSAPKNVKAVPGDSLVSLSWEKSEGAVSYIIYWANDSGVTKSSASIENITLLSYKHTGLINGKTYFYRLASHDGNNITSKLSLEVKAVPDTSKTNGKDCKDGEIYEGKGSVWECQKGTWKCVSGTCADKSK